MALNERAMLVNIRISQWSNRKLDRAATDSVEASYKTNAKVGRFSKNLIPQADSLKDVYSLSASIRKYVEKNTLPWSFDGVVMLPSEHYLEFSGKLSGMVSEWNNLVDVFLAEYPQLLVTAEEDLKGMYNKNEYPDVDAMRDKFGIDIQVMPIPEADFRCGLDSNDQQRLEENVKNTLESISEQATKTLWLRIYERVEKLHERLSKPEAIFHNSLIDNLQEMCELGRNLNVAKDAYLEEAITAIEDSLIEKPSKLRTDPVLRISVSNKAKKMLDIMDQFVKG